MISDINARFLACPHCDALWPRPQLTDHQHVNCGRCHTLLLRQRPSNAEPTLALAIAALVLYVVSIVFPFMRVEKFGLFNEMNIIDTVNTLWSANMPLLALLCGAFIVVFPLLRIFLLLWLSISFWSIDLAGRNQTHTRSRGLGFALRLSQQLEPWTMVEIFMIGVTVSLVKVGSLATVSLGPAFWSMTVMVIVMTIAATLFDKDELWDRIRSSL